MGRPLDLSNGRGKICDHPKGKRICLCLVESFTLKSVTARIQELKHEFAYASRAFSPPCYLFVMVSNNDGSVNNLKRSEDVFSRLFYFCCCRPQAHVRYLSPLPTTTTTPSSSLETPPAYITCLYAVLNVLLTPFILLYRSIQFYLCPCLYTSSITAYHSFLYAYSAYTSPNSTDYLYQDPSFPPGNASLGLPANEQPDSSIQWIRVQDLLIQGKDGKQEKVNKLFNHSASAQDICQGALGDCWLLVHN